MRTKTILIIIFTILITIFLMMNTDAVEFDFIVAKAQVSKLVAVGVCTFIGFILGYLAGRPKTVVTTYDDRLEENHQEGKPEDLPKDSLSAEDREYIS
ncbi:LapA family protein [Pedobacter sp. L105]|uniref:LapA family protein n=1 Tax=Pedobacter sp. L105 TaxID=1641871 RepID=UPI00131B9DF7|nr:LapA family protein [Pedobacter sp. L105]